MTVSTTDARIPILTSIVNNLSRQITETNSLEVRDAIIKDVAWYQMYRADVIQAQNNHVTVQDNGTMI
jgi:hypothetical protein